MAVPSNRSSSSSPSPVAIRSYPNLRHLEIWNAGRKNSNGNLFKKPSVLADPKGFNDVTPASFHSDFPRIGKEGGVPPHHNEKQTENDKNLKPVRIRSPAVSNRTKNIVTPKIASSPRKKVLVKWNELIQTSVSAFSYEKTKSISLLLFLLLVWCLWRTITDSPLVSSSIDYSTGKESSSIELHEAAEVTEIDRTNLAQLTRSPWLWSNNKLCCFSKMINVVKKSNRLSFLQFGNFMESLKEKNLQWPIKEMKIRVVQLKGQGNLVSEEYENDEETSQVNLEFGEAKLSLQVENDQSELEQVSQGKPQLEEENLSPPDEVVVHHDSEVRQIEEDNDLISSEAHNILAEKEYEGQLSLEVKPEADKLQGEEKTISDAEFVAPSIDHNAQSIITEKELKAQVPPAFEIKSELPQAEKLHRENSQNLKELCLSIKEKSSIVYILGASFLILILIVAAGLIFAKQQKCHTVCTNSIPMDHLQAEILASMPTKSGENTHQEKLLTRNWPTEVGESCPSEISSFQRTTSYSIKESKGVSEAQSQERGLRKSNKRDSLASSSEYSMASPSYGSCTSYEKIQNKHGCGDQEVVTSVSSSTKIRNQDIIVDRSLPPYDPETNYLAPRPQFLYYNPNQRIERMRLMKCMGLEDCFASGTGEETKSKNSPSTKITEGENEEQKELKSKKESEFSSELAVGVDVCSQTRLSPPSLASCLPAVGADPSVPPYDPKTNYLAPRPRFLYYKPNLAIEKIRLRERKLLEDCFTSESLSNNETSQETQSESSSVELVEEQNEEVTKIETPLLETAQEEPNASEPRTSEGKVVSKSYSFFTLKLIYLLVLLVLVWWFWISVTDNQLISLFVDSSIDKESRFTKLYEPAELAEFARTNFNVLTRNFRRWSTDTVSYFSKMILILEKSNEPSFLQLGNFTDSQVDLVGGLCLVNENQQHLQWPLKELETGTVLLKEQSTIVTKAYECQDPEHDHSELKKIQEYNVSYHVDIEQASLGKPKLQEANLSLKKEVVEPNNSELQQTVEEGMLISLEGLSILAEKDQEGEVPQVFEVEEPQAEEKLISDTEVDPKAEEPHGEEKPVAEVVKPEAEELRDKVKPISDAEIEPEGEELHAEKPISDAEVVTSHIDYEAESIIIGKEQESQVPQVSEMKSELPQVENFPSKDKLIFNAEVESSGAASEAESSESETLAENSQSFEELYLSLKEKSCTVKALAISLLILVVTVGGIFIPGKQRKTHSPSAAAITTNQFLAKILPSMAAASAENSNQERLPSRIWMIKVDMVGQSCPSEMSSNQRTTYLQKRGSKRASSSSECLMVSSPCRKKELKGSSFASEYLTVSSSYSENELKGASSTSEYLTVSPSYSKNELKGESSASEYSMVSSSYSKNEFKGTSEAQSQQRGLRKSNKRESLVSHSDCSIRSSSYGSFTSYEKISHKHGGGQEVVIPVRRSCRIKNHVASS